MLLGRSEDKGLEKEAEKQRINKKRQSHDFVFCRMKDLKGSDKILRQFNATLKGELAN